MSLSLEKGNLISNFVGLFEHGLKLKTWGTADTLVTLVHVACISHVIIVGVANFEPYSFQE